MFVLHREILQPLGIYDIGKLFVCGHTGDFERRWELLSVSESKFAHPERQFKLFDVAPVRSLDGRRFPHF